MHLHFRLAATAAAVASLPYPMASIANELAPIVVTATRQATRANDLMADVTVIDREEIEQAGQSTLEQLLTRQPGIQYTANGGPGTSSSILIRGASSKQSVVLIDGQRVGSATTGEAAFSRIPLSQIDHIEILRGPASSLYGADAIGGVIQIFTKKGDGEPHFNASTGFGTYSTNETSVGVSGGNELVSYNLQGGYYTTDSVSANHNKRSSSYNPDNDGYRNNSLAGSLSIRPVNGHEIGANFLTTNGTSRYDNGPSTSIRKNDYKNNQDVSNESIWSRNRLSPDWTSTVRIGRSTDKSTQTRDGIETGTLETTQDQYVWQNDIKLPLGNALLAAEYLNQSISGTTNFTANERTIRSLLAGWTAGIDNHQLQFNLRRDDNSQFGGKTTGSATYGYQITPTWRAHASYGTAFRAPTFNELYFPNTFGATFAGNPNLKPEESKNAETGVAWETSQHRFSATYFHNKVNDLIIGYPLVNVSSATLEGVSLSYTGRVGPWSGGISTDFQRPRDDDTGNRLIRRADQQMFSHLSHSFGNWTVGGEWQLVGHRYDNTANTIRLGGYGLVNVLAEYRVEKDWVLFARGNNIFDKYYETANNYGTWGATAFFGLRYAPK